jgi:hypothetical protein
MANIFADADDSREHYIKNLDEINSKLTQKIIKMTNLC